MKELALVITGVNLKREDVYDDLLFIARQKDPEINQVLISIGSAKAYCYKNVTAGPVWA